jgi:rubrerythrin
MTDLKFIAGMSEPELAELRRLMPHPELRTFLRHDTEALLDLRERLAVDAHMSMSSKPPWFKDDQVVNLDDDDWRDKVHKIAQSESNTDNVQMSEAKKAQIIERELSLQANEARLRREGHVHTSEVTRIPSEVDNANRSSILEVEQSNRFAALAKLVDDAEAGSSANVTYTCNKPHCTGGHFQGASAKKDYARHIEVKHRSELTKSERNLNLWQCKTCGKVTYTNENAAKKHQDGCAAQSPEVQARDAKK